MVCWGLAIGLLGALVLLVYTPEAWPIMGSRASGLRDSLTMIEHRGPLLLGRHSASGTLYAVDAADDPGIYVYLPLLARLFGAGDPVHMLRYAYTVLFALTAASYPIVFFALTRSLLAGLVAPLMLLACGVSLGFDDIYWVPAWGYLTFLPLVFLLVRNWPRYGFAALVGLALAASWLTSIRSAAGLPIVIAAAIVPLLRRERWRRVAPALAAMGLAYISIGTFVIGAIREHRDGRISPVTLDSGQLTSHPLWHPAYLGLGYLPNDYGIRFEDGVAAARVQRDAPGTIYASKRYERVLRKAFFDVVRHHPLAVAKQYAAKVVVTAADTFLYVWPVLLVLPAMLLVGPARRLYRWWTMLMLPAVILSFLPTLITIPLQAYEEGLYGVIGLLAILCVCWALERAESASREHGGLRAALTTLADLWSTPGIGPLRRAARISAIALVLTLCLVIGGHFIRRSAERWQGAASGVLINDVPAARSGAPV
jgi:hypothetical protein